MLERKDAQYKILWFLKNLFCILLYLVECGVYGVMRQIEISITDMWTEIVFCLFLCYKKSNRLYYKDSDSKYSFSVLFYFCI